MKGFLLVLVAMLTSPLVGNNDELIGGRIAKPGEFPEIIYIRSVDAYCSATVIGSEVILTAAHCVADEGDVQNTGFDYVDFVIEKQIYHAHCKQAPLYKADVEDHDMALCKTDRPLSIEPASVSKTAPKLGEIVMLSGYGCIEVDADGDGHGGNDGTLRIGKAKVKRLPRGKYHWFDTAIPQSTLCSGDSGGPAMFMETHKVIGVNSRGDSKSLSMMTALWTAKSIEFFQKYAEKEKVSICGITEDC